jgi:hypothetical protein
MKILHFLFNSRFDGGSYFPEYFLFVDFFPNLFNKSGKKQTGNIMQKDGCRKMNCMRIKGRIAQYKGDGPFYFWGQTKLRVKER